MKTALKIICILIIGTLLFAFTYQSSITTEIVLFRDVTDKYISKPDANEILSLFDLSSENKWNGAKFRYSTLSDVSYNKTIEIKIEPANKWLSNEIERNKELKKFKDELTEIITIEDTTGKTHSSLYLPLARELKELSQSKSQKRIVFVYSDLMENNPDVSLYDKEEFKLLQSNPESLKKLFESWQPLPSLNGISVFLIYQPADIEKDREFKEVSAFYKNLLEERGARVTVSANLSI